jgi:hypothetical protein
VTLNGRQRVTIKTIHGRFKFETQRLVKGESGQALNYLSYTGQFQDGYESERLREWVCYAANRLSYHELVKEIERVTGDRLLSAPRIRELVVNKASQISQIQAQQVKKISQNASRVPQLNENIDLYDPGSEEVLLMCDGISVKRQKARRSSGPPLATQPKEPKRVTTDVVMLQQTTGQFRYLMAGLNEETSLAEGLKAALINEYEDYPSLNLVAITDGARNIRLLFEQVFDQPVTLILDWYHLRKKCYELMSMIARNKTEKETHIQIILAHLWQGQTNEALAYLQTQLLVRNQIKFEELLTYLRKHTSEIINYEKRQLAGKTIGSGRMEKGVDQTIGHRQKRKGLSWRDLGSRALGLLKMVELNHQWHTLWVF